MSTLAEGRHKRLCTSVVVVSNKMLLVPESKMISRAVLRAEVVLPLTEIPDELSSQSPSLEDKVAYVRSPLNLELSMPPMVNSAFPAFCGVRYRLNKARMMNVNKKCASCRCFARTRKTLLDEGGEKALSLRRHSYCKTKTNQSPVDT